MGDISNSIINERSNVEKKAELRVTIIKNKIYIKGQYENRPNCEWCEISNGRTIPKFANFFNFDNFPNYQENLNSKNI